MNVTVFSMLSFYIEIKYQNGRLTLTRPIGLPPHAPIAQKIADQRWRIRQKIGTFFILNDVIESLLVWINIVRFLLNLIFSESRHVSLLVRRFWKVVGYENLNFYLNKILHTFF